MGYPAPHFLFGDEICSKLNDRMNKRNVALWIPIFTVICIHLVQCKYLHRRNDDTDNTVQGKPPPQPPNEKDGDGESSAPNKMDGDGESSGPDKKDGDGESSAPNKMDGDGESSAPDKKDGDGESSAPNKMDGDGESSAPDKKDGDGESSAPNKMDGDGESSAPDKKDGDGESSAPNKMDGDGESSAPDQKDGDGESSTPNKINEDGKLSAPDKKDGDGESSAPNKMEGDGESSAPDKKDGDGESSAPNKMDGDGVSSASDKKDEDCESSAPDKMNEDGESYNKNGDSESSVPDKKAKVLAKKRQSKSRNCWFPIKAHEHFIEMDKLDRKYADQRNAGSNFHAFDKEMLDAMLKTRSIAERALQKFGGVPNLIPAGLNLGGHCMMRMPQSVLFFHRLKLRNNTRFRINFLENDLRNMLLTTRLSLNDLHLLGDYERAITYDMPSILYYTPTYGQLEILLKDVEYKVEGRYRLINDRLYVEHIISELQPRSILMRYMEENNTASMTTIKLEEKNIYDYLQRMQNDLDQWLKDYFNDFLIYLDLPQTGKSQQNQEYENAKTGVRNRFTDRVIQSVRKRLREVNASSIAIPNFKIHTIGGMGISLYDGVIRGLDSIYRRSVATGKLDKKSVRHVDTIVAFSSLKVEYKYEMFLGNGVPALFGMIVMDADELTGRLALRTVRDSPTLDMHFTVMPPMSEARSLVVEGPANRYIAKYKNILEHQIISIMSSTMVHYMHQLDSLARCSTLLIGKDDPNYKTIDQSESVETNIDDKKPPENGQTGDDGHVTIPSSGDEKKDVTTPSSGEEEIDKPFEQKIPEDYIVSRKESMELEFPPKEGNEKGEKMLVKVNEKFSLTRLNKSETRTG